MCSGWRCGKSGSAALVTAPAAFPRLAPDAAGKRTVPPAPPAGLPQTCHLWRAVGKDAGCPRATGGHPLADATRTDPMPMIGESRAVS
jgi:hypothetical protein